MSLAARFRFRASQKSNVIVSAVNFRGNPNDNKTLEKTLDQQERMTGVRPKKGFVDRGYKSRKVSGTLIQAPTNGSGLNPYETSKLRKNFRRRAAIEPIIGHAKSDFGMDRNYLKGEIGDAINAMLAASASNFKNWMRKALAQLIFVSIYMKQIYHQFQKQPKLNSGFDY